MIEEFISQNTILVAITIALFILGMIYLEKHKPLLVLKIEIGVQSVLIIGSIYIVGYYIFSDWEWNWIPLMFIGFAVFFGFKVYKNIVKYKSSERGN